MRPILRTETRLRYAEYAGVYWAASPTAREVSMAGICDGRVVIVTGAGRGLGRAHALEFARQGARVVVNDVGAELDGTGSSSGPAGEVVDQIRATGGDAIANGDDVADFAQSEHLVRSAIERWGSLDVVVNNAGILRDRMIFNMSVEDFDAVIRVHLRGTWCMCHHAAVYWRDKSKDGTPVDARIINTTSPAGLYTSMGQTNYGPAKAGIANMTIILAAELGRYGVTVNAISPGARTRMTETIRRPGGVMAAPADGFDAGDPANISPLVVWLGSAEARQVTGRVFNVRGGSISVAEPWHAGPEADKHERWDPAELGPVVQDLLARAAPRTGPFGQPQVAADAR
jgi:NAD(P)-dependent dehydrogenase (short-subunit alcohol dehydrogenase family)